MKSEAAMVRRRLEAQLLTKPLDRSVLPVVERLLAVQAQDLRGARLAIRARSTGLTVADVDRALAERRLVVSWLNRGTLHLVRSEDFHWLHALTASQHETSNRRRLGQEGVPQDAAERGVKALLRALDGGPRTRAELRDQVAAADVRVEGQALVHVLFLAALRGLIVRGPMREGEQAFVLTRDWLGKPPKALDRDVALGLLARRFLGGHGPAGPRDLAKWAELTLTEARRALSGIRAELEEVAGDQVALRGGAPVAEAPAPRLLGAFDPLLHGWVSRAPIVGTAKGIVTTNGVFRPIALVDGKAVATWTFPRGEVVLAPFARISAADRTALAKDAEDVRRFLEVERRR